LSLLLERAGLGHLNTLGRKRGAPSHFIRKKGKERLSIREGRGNRDRPRGHWESVWKGETSFDKKGDDLYFEGGCRGLMRKKNKIKRGRDSKGKKRRRGWTSRENGNLTKKTSGPIEKKGGEDDGKNAYIGESLREELHLLGGKRTAIDAVEGGDWSRIKKRKH